MKSEAVFSDLPQSPGGCNPDAITDGDWRRWYCYVNGYIKNGEVN